MRIEEVKKLIGDIEKQTKKIAKKESELEIEKNKLEGLQDNLRSAMEGDYSYIEVEEKTEIIE